MKKIASFLMLLLLCSSYARAQSGNSLTISFNGVPTGSCSYLMYAINKTNGDFYDCFLGAWFKVGPGSGGGVTSVTASAPILSSGGVTPDISCPTCITGFPRLDQVDDPQVDTTIDLGGNFLKFSDAFPYIRIDGTDPSISWGGGSFVALDATGSIMQVSARDFTTNGLIVENSCETVLVDHISCTGLTAGAGGAPAVGMTVDAVTQLFLDHSVNGGAGTIANYYGLNIQDQNSGVTNYAIKTGLGQVDFGDTVKGASTINAVTGFQVNGAATLGNVLWGNGTNFVDAGLSCADLSDDGSLCASSGPLPSNEAGAANNFLTAYNSGTGAFSKAQPTWANIDKTTSSLADLATRACANLSDAGTGCSGAAYPGLATHKLLSATHTGTTAADPVRGDIIYADSTPSWTKLALGAATAGKYAKSDGTDVIISTGSASGTGACGAGDFVSTLNADAAPTCGTPPGASGANVTLSNLTNGAVAVNTSLISDTAATDNLGSAAIPWANIFIGNAANKSLTFDVSALSADRSAYVPNAASTLVVPNTGAANNFLTAVSALGVVSNAQPACASLSDAGTLCTSSGPLAASEAGAANNFLTAYNAATGAFSKAQPSSSNLSDASNVALYNNGSKTWGATASFNWTFDAGATDPVFEFTSGNVKFSGATTYTYEGGATDPVWTPGNSIMDLTTGTLKQGGNAVALVSNNLSVFAATTSAQLYGILSDETGSATGTPLAVFNQTPTIATPSFTTGFTIGGAAVAGQHIAANGTNFVSATPLGAQVGSVFVSKTMTNIGNAYVDIYVAAFDAEDMMKVDFTGVTSVRAVYMWDYVGTGTQQVRWADAADNTNVLIEAATITADADAVDTGWVALPAAFVGATKTIEWQGKSTTAGDDPVAKGYVLFVR